MSGVMTTPRLAERAPDLQGLSVLVIGLGRSGLAAARLALGRGARVRITDRQSEDALADIVAAARQVGAEVLTGGHPPELVESTDLVVVSPGVPSSIPLLATDPSLKT